MWNAISIAHWSRRQALLLLTSFCPFWPCPSSAIAAPGAKASRTFHADAIDGDDGRDGLTPATAWRSLTKVNDSPLQPGDSLLFRRGATWRGQLIPHSGDRQRPVTYGAYGDGPKPILLGSAPMDRPEDWTDNGNGIWATAIRFDPKESVADLGTFRWTLHVEAGARASLKVESGTMAVLCEASGQRPNHVQLAATGLSIKKNTDYLLSFDASSTKPFIPAALGVMSNRPPYIRYAIASAPPLITEKPSEHQIRLHSERDAENARLTLYLGGVMPSGATLTFVPKTLQTAVSSQPFPLSVDVGNIIFDAGGAWGIKKWKEEDLSGDLDYFYDARGWRVLLRSPVNPAKRFGSVELALRRHIISQGGKSFITYENLDLRYGAAHGFGGGGTEGITIRDCDISWIGGGHQLTTPAGKPVRFGNGIEFWSSAKDCLVERCRIWEIYDAALTNQGKGTNTQENITYRNNVVWNSEYSFEYWNRGNQSTTRGIRFEHNTCADAGSGWGHGQRPDKNGRHLMFYYNDAKTSDFTIRNNIFDGATESLLRLHGVDWTGALAMDHNVWHQPNGPMFLWGTNLVEVAAAPAFLASRGLGEGDMYADPGFADRKRRDFRLTPDSSFRMRAPSQAPPGALP